MNLLSLDALGKDSSLRVSFWKRLHSGEILEFNLSDCHPKPQDRELRQTPLVSADGWSLHTQIPMTRIQIYENYGEGSRYHDMELFK